MKRVKITIKNIYFIVTLYDGRLAHVINTMATELSTYSYVYNHKLKRTLKEKDKEYYSYNKQNNSYRFTISLLKDFILLLGTNLVHRDQIELFYDRYTVDVRILNLNINSEYVLKDYQDEYLIGITKDDSPPNILVDLQTGYGKSLIAVASIIKLNMRAGILILPKYIEKWIIDLKRYTNIEDEDIFVVQGTESLIELMETPSDQIHYKFIIFSMRTVYFYIDNYENMHINYPIEPDYLMQHLGIGVMLNDEAHQEFYSMFKAMLYFDVKKLIGLSATLDSNQPDIKKIYKTLYPTKNRLSNIVEIGRYTDVYAINYKLASTKGILFKRQQGYNHILYEQSIMRNSVLLNGYVNLILHYIRDGYYKRRTTGDKMLVYASSVMMCTLLTSRIQNEFKDLDVRRYVEDDPFSNIMEADLTITTIISSGTAIDVPNLITVLNTISMSSLQANMQVVGRLRKLPNKETRYYYLYSKSIQNQVKMHFDRKDAIKHLVNNYINVEYEKTLNIK